ncbi:MAG: hypothetical protein OEL76_11870 [Siculibacillus sp.]|nr:hypothetical protein [Siculibacillus sp.]
MTTATRRSALFGLGLLGALLAGPTATAEETETPPRLIPHQGFVEDVLRSGELPVADPRAMFTWVVSQLPERVKVWPTESYWYFSFFHRGVKYAGNIRLDAKDRDAGKVHFAYFEDLAEWRVEPEMSYLLLDETHGVKLERVEPFLYRLTANGRSVLFEINDMKGVKPPPEAVLADETLIGPVFDDSAVRFFLVWNRKAKVFHYVLDETGPPLEDFLGMNENPRTLIGKRTGFAYYLDPRTDRKILIGVFEGNSRVNNAYDGPFDQLPDAFIVGDTLRDAIIAHDPNMKGKIDRYGGLADGTGRFLIAPYRYYREAEDLFAFHECATDPAIPARDLPLCFSMNWDVGEAGELAAHTARREAARAAKAARAKKAKKPAAPASRKGGATTR